MLLSYSDFLHKIYHPHHGNYWRRYDSNKVNIMSQPSRGFPHHRLRRLRGTKAIRDLVRETSLRIDHLIFPIFIKAGITAHQPIPTMPGHYQLAINQLAEDINHIATLGIKTILIFGIPNTKDEHGSNSIHSDGIVSQAIHLIKQTAPQLQIITDLCVCSYTTHGHCGVLQSSGQIRDIDNDQTLKLLQQQALCHAQAGADIIAPSGMIDGMVQAIRAVLDTHGFTHIPILSYAIKYASAMYGPFRQAAEGAPQFGDRRTYQMDPANTNEALREAEQDLLESADMLMVKPGHTYLDIIYKIKQAYPTVPLGAFHTSGEWAMIKAAAQAGWVSEQAAALEVLTSIKRAGADFILTYYAKECCQWLTQHSID